MDNRTYKKMRGVDLIGRRVRLLSSVKNGAGQVAHEGALLTIREKSSGLSLEADPCPHCHLGMFVRRVQPWAVELLEESAPTLPAGAE